MKIAHVVDSMEVGGAETLVVQMCRGQRELGHDPSVFAVASLGPLGEQLTCEGFEVHANTARHLYDAIPRFYRAFRNLRPDVVHLHNPTPTIYAAQAAKTAGTSCIISTRHSLVGPPRRVSVELKYGVAAASCNWIVGICNATCNNLKSLHTVPVRKIVRIYNGTLPIKRAPLESCPSKGGFTLLFVGRLAPVKNLPLLLRAFRTALVSEPGLRLWLVGDGSERAQLKRMAQDLNITGEVTFWGQQLDVTPFFSAADAFIMSSTSEGLPMSLLQALSIGLPAIVTDVGGMGEVVRLANAGIAAFQDEVDMSNAILRLNSDVAGRRLLSVNASAAFHKYFEFNQMVDGYMRLYMKRSPERDD